MKKLLSLLTMAVFLLPALPVGAATQTGNVTLKWNVSASLAMTLYTTYTATPSSGTTATEFTATNGGTGNTCTAPASETAGTVDFGAIVPDLVDVTGCLYTNAVDANIVTNSVNWSLGEALAAALPTGYAACALPNGSYTFGSAPTTLPVTQSTRTSAPAGTTCAGITGSSALSTTSLAMITSDATAFTSASPANVGEDIQLLVPAGASTGAQTATLTFTAVAN